MCPRRRLDPWETLAKQRQQEATDRRQRDAILARQAAEVVAKPDNLPDYDPDEAPPAEEAPEPAFNYDRYTLELRASQWVQQRFAGLGERTQRRLAEQVLHAMQSGDTSTLARLNSKARNSRFQVHWALMPGGPTQWHPGLPLTPRPW